MASIGTLNSDATPQIAIRSNAFRMVMVLLCCSLVAGCKALGRTRAALPSPRESTQLVTSPPNINVQPVDSYVAGTVDPEDGRPTVQLASSITRREKPDIYANGCYRAEFEPAGWVWPSQNANLGPTVYIPREGDLVFTSSKSAAQTLYYRLFPRVGFPHHPALVVRRASGNLATLEVGSGGDRSVALRPIYDRLNTHKETFEASVIAIRRIKEPLTDLQSYRLTCFAEAQLGKAYVSQRELLPLVLPARPVGDTFNSQETWYCSELVVQALRDSGVLVGVGKPKAFMPEDLFVDDKYDLSNRWTAPLDWTPTTEPTKAQPRWYPSRAQ